MTTLTHPQRTGRDALIGILLVAGCSFLDAGAQLFFKWGANSIPLLSGLAPSTIPLGIVVGYGLYAASAVLLIYAFQRGELSVLFPFLALTYVWIVLLSPLFFNTDTWNTLKFVGVFSIVAGVSLIGAGRAK